ncbi:MAG TPA: hypothetical protein VFB82_14035, partial [Blastocatellia bacterium]|nr:hypothetical protein [Blastocatellia bacterium]
WTSQGLKDGPIVLCMCLCVLYAMKVRNKLEVSSFLILLAALLGLYTLRHYCAYIMLAATAGSLIFTSGNRFTPVRMLQGFVAVIVIGLAFSYLGAGEVATTLDLKMIQNARVWGAAASNSGFGGDVDITDPQAAIGFLPLGILYVLLSPFPWMINNVKQLITLPELVAWWCLKLMMVRGFWFALRHRLQQMFVICTLVLGLTLAFALYESNAGTAYRHRAQLYVFFFIFIAIGLELRRQAKLHKRSPIVMGRPSFTNLPPQRAPITVSGRTIDPRMS